MQLHQCRQPGRHVRWQQRRGSDATRHTLPPRLPLGTACVQMRGAPRLPQRLPLPPRWRHAPAARLPPRRAPCQPVTACRQPAAAVAGWTGTAQRRVSSRHGGTPRGQRQVYQPHRPREQGRRASGWRRRRSRHPRWKAVGQPRLPQRVGLRPTKSVSWVVEWACPPPTPPPSCMPAVQCTATTGSVVHAGGAGRGRYRQGGAGAATRVPPPVS